MKKKNLIILIAVLVGLTFVISALVTYKERGAIRTWQTMHGKDPLERGKIYARLNRHTEAIAHFKKELEKHPDSFEAHFALGQSYQLTGELDRALAEYELATTLKPDSTETELEIATTYLNKAIQARNTGKDDATVSEALQQALESCNEVTSRNPKDLKALVLRGKICVEQNEKEKAVSCFKEVLALEKGNIPAHLGLINFYTLNRDYKRAESQCLEALGQNPDNFSIGLNLAILYNQQGRFEEAIQTLQKLAKKKQDQFQAYLFSGLTYLKMGKYEEALEAVDAAAKVVPNEQPVIEYIRGIVALQKKDHVKAIAHLRQASIRMPNSAEAHFFLALALLDTGKKEEAKTELMSAITHAPEYTPARLTLAQLLAREARWDETIDYSKEILQQDPENIVALELLGSAYQAQGRFKEASGIFNKLMDLDPASASINLAHTSFVEGKVGKCLRLCNDLLAEDPNQPRVLYLKGLGLTRTGDVKGAYQCFKQALELEPDSVPTSHQLARVAMITGNKEEAITLLTENLRRNKKDLTSRLLLAKIYEETNDLDRSMKELKQATDVDINFLPAYVSMGMVCLLQQNYDEAVDAYKKAVRLEPGRPLSHIGLGLAYHLTEDLEGAERALKDAFHINQDSPAPTVMLGNVYLHSNQPERALELIEDSSLNQAQKELCLKFINDFNTIRPDHKVLLGLNEAIFFELNRSYTQALERCKEVSKIMPGNPLVSMYLANLLALKGKHEEALDVYEGLTLATDTRLSAVYQEMGRTYLMMKDFSSAERAFEEAAAVGDKTSSLSRLQLSQLYLQKGDVEKAKAMAKDVLLQDPDNALALNLLGQAHLLTGELAEAQTDFSKARGEEQLQGLSEYNLARTLLAKGEVENCIKECKQGLEKNPLDPALHYLLGMAFLRKQDPNKALEEFTNVIDINPSYVPAYLQIATIHNLRGMSVLAVPVCKLALEFNPESLEAKLMLAGSYIGLRSYDQAIEQYQKLLAEKDGQPQALFGLATAHLLKGDSSKAMEIAQNLLSKKSDMPQAQILLAEAYRKQGRNSEALRTLESLQKAHPQNVPVATLAALYIQQGEYARCSEITQGHNPQISWIGAVASQLNGQYLEARSSCEQASLARQGDIAIQMSLANIALASGQKQEAQALIEQTNLVPKLKQAYSDLISTTPEGIAPKLAAYLNTMLVYTAVGWLEEALEECKKAEALRPESVVTASLMGESLIATGQRQKAIETFASIIQKDATFSPAYQRLASIYTSKGEDDSALSLYRKLVEIEPSSTQAHLELALLLEKKGQFEESIEEYKKVLSLSPKSTGAVIASNNLAWTLATKHGNTTEALALAQKAKELAPNLAGVRDTLGWIYYLNGQYTEALKELHQATKLDYGNPTMHYHLGMAYLKKGMGPRALAQFRRSVKGNVDFPERKEAEKLIQEIQSGKAEGFPVSTSLE
jgi:tetratricopeptide (TPR) repeat protein